MIRRLLSPATLATVVVSMMLATAAMLASAGQPLPPPQVCVGTPPNCAKTAAPVTTGGYKWHPGHYVWVSGFGWSPSYQASVFSMLDSIGSDDTITGVVVRVNWFYFEGAQGDYSPGYAMVDAILAKLDSLPHKKHLILGFVERTFGSSTGKTPGSAYPPYVVSNGWVVNTPVGQTWPGRMNSVATIWEPAVAARVVALGQAFGKRYNSNPLFEAFAPTHVSSIGVPNGTFGYTNAGWIPTLMGIWDAVQPSWPNTLLRLELDYVGNIAEMVQLQNHAALTKGYLYGAVDPEMPLPVPSQKTIAGNMVFRGLNGGTDLRGIQPWIGEIQAMGFGTGSGYPYSYPPADILTYEEGTMHASYMVWMDNTWVGDSTQRWTTGILPYVKSIGAKIDTGCPSALAGLCNTQ